MPLKKINNPFFTIITICLNAGISLKQTLASILVQDFIDFEIIVKDGGSVDDSINLIPNDKRIKLITREDKGIYDAMNQALEYSNGQYILFLNADDFFYDHSILRSFKDSAIYNNYPTLIYCDYTTTHLGEYVLSPNKLSSFFLFRTMLCHQVCMIKKDSYSKLGFFDTDLKVVADYDFLLRLIILEKANYMHIHKLGIISTSKGFSFQNNEIAKKEVKLIRRKFFQKYFLVYSILYSLTFPLLRGKITSGSGLLSRLYQRLVNGFNRYF